MRRERDPGQASRAETIKSLQREALRYLTSWQRSSDLGDCLELGVDDRRSMTHVLRELRLDDVRVVSLDSALTPALRQKRWLRSVSVVRIGRDLDASTADVLRSLEPLMLEETVLLFDHWEENAGAFNAWLGAHPGITARRLSSDATHAQSFVVTRAPTV
ncbi:MAG TPA: hypothetical protein VFX59_18585 [Polyangiales bacterium]|nr:hypothetical protein [Polyangiales bacterium]